MSAANWLGAFLMALPFIALSIYVICEDGIRALVFVVCFVAVVMGMILLGTYLLFGGAA